MIKRIALILCAATAGTVTAATAAPVTDTATMFMPGMRVELPSKAWTVYEDHPGEFNIKAPPSAATHIHFWLDPLAAKPTNMQRVIGVGRTPSALIHWLRHNTDFRVTNSAHRRIAHGLAANSIDFKLSRSAPRVDRGCPGPRRDVFVFKGRHYSFDFGIGGDTTVRLYLGRLAGHTFAVAVESDTATAFGAVIPHAHRIVTSVILPSRVTAG